MEISSVISWTAIWWFYCLELLTFMQICQKWSLDYWIITQSHWLYRHRVQKLSRNFFPKSTILMKNSKMQKLWLVNHGLSKFIWTLNSADDELITIICHNFRCPNHMGDFLWFKSNYSHYRTNYFYYYPAWRWRHQCGKTQNTTFNNSRGTGYCTYNCYHCYMCQEA